MMASVLILNFRPTGSIRPNLPFVLNTPYGQHAETVFALESLR
jgi:hypothetical protein